MRRISINPSPSAVTDRPRQSTLTLKSLASRSMIGVLLMGILSACPSSKKQEASGDPQGQVLPKTPEPAEETADLDYQKMARDLQPYVAELDEENAERLKKVIELLSSGLQGIGVERTDFRGQKNIRTATSYKADPKNLSDLSLQLNETWNPNSTVDLVLLAHELLHAVEVREAKQTLSEEDWWKQYALNGNAVEIRKELVAWEFMLALLNEMSGKLMDEFCSSMSSASDAAAANQVLEEYVEKVSQKLNTTPDQKELLERWLQIYFTYKLSEVNQLDCKWSYNFVMQVASEYMETGVPIYELEQAPEQNGATPEACVYPLKGGPYHSGVRYEFKPNGTVGLGQTMRFEKKD